MPKHLLAVDNIVKEFSAVRAVDRLSFQVKKGEIFALLGPNGAGKTTTVRMVMGVIRPDRGQIDYFIDSETPIKPSPADLGYLPEDRGLYPEIPILKTLVYMGVLRGMTRVQATVAAKQWLERVELGDRTDDKLNTLSNGNQKKVQFIAAVLHQPKFVLLDEPFAGLDPVNQDFFIEIIRDLRDRGTTILLSAHQMNLVERLADRVLLMDRGREVLQGTIPEIKNSFPIPDKIVLGFAVGQDISALSGHPVVESFETLVDGQYAFLIKQGESVGKFLAAAASLDITAIHSESVSLHEIYVRAVGHDRRPQEAGRDA